MKRIVFTLLLMLSLGASGIRAAGLTGKVLDSHGHPLGGVSVTTDVSGVGTTTDSSGMFELSRLDNVTRVTFSSVGYQARQFRIADVPPTITLNPIFYHTQDVVVTADRADAAISPVPFSNFTREDLSRDYQVGEFPLLLESTPNLYAYSDGGGALGYSYMSIRGFDDKRITTYINGVPLNDPEDQATYFVDLPDFASTVTDIQVQRGVGNSLYGDASFGGSVNIATNAFARERNIKLTSGYGEYRSGGRRVGDITKQSIDYSSGLVDGRWQFTGRFSNQQSSGYRENSWYDGWAYYFSVARVDPRMTTELHWYGGPMHMHLAYYGVARYVLDSLGRRYNPLTYSNETDNFNQPHYQLHNVYKLSDHATLTNTLYYIHGKGYYEQLKDGSIYREYDIDSSMYPPGDSVGNIVRQQWVRKDQYGWNPRLDIDHPHGRHSLGGSFYYFDSDHWGQVVWAQNISGPLDPQHRYYEYFGKKWIGSFYGQELYRLTDRLNAQATVQLRYQRYKFDQTKMGAFKGYQYDVNWMHLSPRIGVNYAVTPRVNVYANFAVSSRTPTDAEIYDAGDPEKFPSLEVDSMKVRGSDTAYWFGQPTAKSERVLNLELGSKYRTERAAVGVNLFWMDFRHEILAYGGINPNNGLEMTVNADRSIHSGIELTADVVPMKSLKLSANWAFNYNRVKKYSSAFTYATAEGDSIYTVDFKDKTLSGFPSYLGSLLADYSDGRTRVTYRMHFAGKQYMELYNFTSLAIREHIVSSVTASYSLTRFRGIGTLKLSVTIDNLFNVKYESSGYGGNYTFEGERGVEVGGWAEYFVGAERNFYTQLELDLF